MKTEKSSKCMDDDVMLLLLHGSKHKTQTTKTKKNPFETIITNVIGVQTVV